MNRGESRLRSLRKGLGLPSALLLAGAGLALDCQAGDASRDGWYTLTAENNNFVVNQDKHYVNGLNFAYLSAPLSFNQGWADRNAMAVENDLPWLFPGGAQIYDRRYEWTALGQQMFTPADKNVATPNPMDRPYAGWLYTGVSLLQDRDAHRLEDLSASIGVVGPAAFARQVQNSFHKVFGYGNANGWDHQLHNEPAVTLGYLRKWRFGRTLSPAHDFGVDLVPELGATVGNVLTYAEATALLRIGTGLDAGYGPRVLQPGLAGGGYFNPDRVARRWGVNVFGGIQQRAVGRNIFLDGNSYQSSPSVDKYTFVHDEVFGFSAFGWRSVRAELTYVRRSREFHTQRGDDRYGSINLSARW